MALHAQAFDLGGTRAVTNVDKDRFGNSCIVCWICHGEDNYTSCFSELTPSPRLSEMKKIFGIPLVLSLAVACDALSKSPIYCLYSQRTVRMKHWLYQMKNEKSLKWSSVSSKLVQKSWSVHNGSMQHVCDCFSCRTFDAAGSFEDNEAISETWNLRTQPCKKHRVLKRVLDSTPLCAIAYTKA